MQQRAIERLLPPPDEESDSCTEQSGELNVSEATCYKYMLHATSGELNGSEATCYKYMLNATNGELNDSEATCYKKYRATEASPRNPTVAVRESPMLCTTLTLACHAALK